MAAALRLIPRERRIEPTAVGTQSNRRFLDFEVDGQSLYDILTTRGFDLIGIIWIEPETKAEADTTIGRLLGEAPSDLPDDRVAVFVCPKCGDLGCGAVTIRLRIEPGIVRWEEWGWQTNHHPEVDRTELLDLPDITFNREKYEAVLRSRLR